MTHLPRGEATCLRARPSPPPALATNVLRELCPAVHFLVVHGCFPPPGHCDIDPMAHKIQRGLSGGRVLNLALPNLEFGQGRRRPLSSGSVMWSNILFFEMTVGIRPPVSFPPGETQARNLAGRPREQQPLVTKEPAYPGSPGTVVVLKPSLGFQEPEPRANWDGRSSQLTEQLTKFGGRLAWVQTPLF